jgi:hypothetical protein
LDLAGDKAGVPSPGSSDSALWSVVRQGVSSKEIAWLAVFSRHRCLRVVVRSAGCLAKWRSTNINILAETRHVYQARPIQITDVGDNGGGMIAVSFRGRNGMIEKR